MVYHNPPQHQDPRLGSWEALPQRRCRSGDTTSQPGGADLAVMATAAENGSHKTIALFDVDGTLTVPRKVWACPHDMGNVAACQNRVILVCQLVHACTSDPRRQAAEQSLA